MAADKIQDTSKQAELPITVPDRLVAGPGENQVATMQLNPIAISGEKYCATFFWSDR